MLQPRRSSVAAYKRRGSKSKPRCCTQTATYPAAYQTALTQPALNLANSVTSTVWHGTFNVPLHIAQAGKLRTNTYDAKGNITAQSDTPTTDTTGAQGFAAVRAPNVNVTSQGWAYNAQGLPTSITQSSTWYPAGIVTSAAPTTTVNAKWAYSYNALGDTIAITDNTLATASTPAASIPKTTLTYNAHGQLTRRADSNGAAASFVWNARGQMVQSTVPQLASTATAANPTGAGAASVMNITSTFTIDARGLVTQIAFSNGYSIRFTYDKNHTPIKATNQLGQVIAQASTGLNLDTLGTQNEGLPADSLKQLKQLLSPPALAGYIDQTLTQAAQQAKAQSVDALQTIAKGTLNALIPTAQAQSLLQLLFPSLTNAQGASLASSQSSSASAGQSSSNGNSDGSGLEQCCGAGNTSAASGLNSALNTVEKGMTAPFVMLANGMATLGNTLTDIVLLKTNSEKLACAIKDERGEEKSKDRCEHTHHIVAYADKRAEKSREKLRSVGITNLNSAINGVFLPCAYHSALHTNAYYDRVEKSLLQANNLLEVSAVLVKIRGE